MSSIKWLPLESNPEVMNKFLENLGVPFKWGISDIISLDEEFLHMIPSPVLAVLLLFPITEKYQEHCDKQEELLKTEKQDTDPDVFFMHQTIRNACGTVALIHAIANNMDSLCLDSESVVKKFIEESRSLSPREKAEILESSQEISAAHEAMAQQGQTEAPGVDDEINLHFIALVNVNSKLYDLDGRKSVPICCGPTSKESFMKDAAAVCKEYMERDPNNLNFTALSFGAL
ncbi:ubiquitin carboxyl-terminal hydrolase isozyme L3 isoform X2 [Parasteatoda tepidariorum]